VSIQTGANFSARNPHVLLKDEYFVSPGGGHRSYDVSRDGQRFL
jgi:hypothetical protein